MKGLFSVSMYKEQMRRLKLPSFILMLLTVFAMVMFLVIVILTDIQKDAEEMTPTVIHGALAPFVALFLTELMLKDMRTRNGSDFYHAMPITRRAAMLSSFAAAISWTLIFVIVPTVLELLLSILFGMTPQNWETYAEVSLYVVVCSIYFVGASFMGHSLTGSRFSHFIVSAIIVIGPRLFLYTTGYLIQVIFPYLLLNRYSFFFDPVKYNLFLRGVIGLSPTMVSTIYTLLLGFVYIGLAMWMIKRKPSEIAGQPTWSVKMETIVRIIVSCAVSFPALLGVLSLIFFEDYWGYADETLCEVLIIAFYSLTVIVYFLYEILQTRKVKNAFKHWKGLIWVAGFNIVFVICMLIVSSVVTKTTPNADEIDTISLVDIRNHLPEKKPEKQYGTSYSEMYYEVKAKTVFSDKKNDEIYEELIFGIPLDSDEIKRAVAEELACAVKEGAEYDFSSNSSLQTSDLRVDMFGPISGDESDIDTIIEKHKTDAFNDALLTGLKIRLKNGKTFYRQLWIPRKALYEVVEKQEFLDRIDSIDFQKEIDNMRKIVMDENGTIIIPYGEGGVFFRLDSFGGEVPVEANVLIEALETDIMQMSIEQKRDFLFRDTWLVFSRQRDILGYYNEWATVCICNDSYASRLRCSASRELTPTLYPYLCTVCTFDICDTINAIGGDANVSN